MLVLVWLLMLAPLPPVCWLWLRGGNSRFEHVVGAVLTASYAWLSAALMLPIESLLIGPPYSDMRVVIPYANVAVVTGVIVIVSVRGRRKFAVLPGILIALCWLYVRVVSFAV